LKTLAHISLLLVIVLVVVSAYLRLHESGIGCPDWPTCYGLIGATPDQSTSSAAESAYQRIVNESDAPLAWAAPLHRLVASLLGLAILFLTGIAIKAKRHRVVCLALLGLTVFLAVIGIRSGSLHNPAIVMGNLGGGFLMLGLLGWLVFRLEPGSAHYTQTRIQHLRSLVLVALVMLGIQITLGGFTSANFAATSCQTIPDCHGSWMPDATIYSAFKMNQPREVTDSGMAVGGLERVAIHKAHRVGAVLAFAAILAAVIGGIMGTGPTQKIAYLVLTLLLAEFIIGVASVMTGLPISLAVAHNWIAGMLLLALLKMLALSRERWIPD
jgi:cytochrome c oxidase assembly protein subunit 15